ncbi:hypothetical protein [Sorangium sp. So ce1097]|uniref:hypothetical protein n=1 Tax=Sorangium sp. So ce1097 TaxID=3133330 RepID=UPI003F5DECBF
MTSRAVFRLLPPLAARRSPLAARRSPREAVVPARVTSCNHEDGDVDTIVDDLLRVVEVP